ncbi:MAG: site-specific integrase [Sulfitobacter sp.]
MPDISIGRLRGGFCVYWRNNEGKRQRYQLEARTRKEAEAEGIDVFRRHHRQNANTVTVAMAWEEYRQSLIGRPTYKTLGYTGKAVLHHLGELRPDHIDRSKCDFFAAQREQEGISIGSVHTELGHLRSALRYAEKTRLIERAPHIWRPAKPMPKERYLTHDEIRHLINCCEAHHIRLAIILLLGTAGRVGAILDLTWERVNFEHGTINLRLDDSKTRKGRAIVPMNGMTRAALQTARDAALSEYVVEYAGDRVKSIRKGFQNACKRADLDDVTIHTLRHSAAVHMVSAGIPMQKVSQYLGHSNTAITERVYARFAPSHMQDAAEVLNFTNIKNARG